MDTAATSPRVLRLLPVQEQRLISDLARRPVPPRLLADLKASSIVARIAARPSWADRLASALAANPDKQGDNRYPEPEPSPAAASCGPPLRPPTAARPEDPQDDDDDDSGDDQGEPDADDAEGALVDALRDFELAALELVESLRANTAAQLDVATSQRVFAASIRSHGLKV